MTTDLLIERHARITTLTLNRPAKKNALTGALYTALADALDTARADDTRVLVLTGRDVFTSGNDIHDFLSGNPAPVIRFLSTLRDFPKPVVVAVEALAIGIGTTLLLHADLVWAGRSTRFQMPFASLGLCPEGGSSLLLPRLAGQARAARWLLLGEAFTTEDAVAAGIVSGVVDDGGALAKTQATALKLAAMAPSALAATKRLMKAPDLAVLPAVMTTEFAHFTAMTKEPEAQEAFAAFLEKRPADFSRF